MAGGGLSGGTGQKLTQATIIVAGVASLLASLLSIVLVSSTMLAYLFWLTCHQQLGVASDVMHLFLETYLGD
jgi:hypothetical protein